MTDVTELATDGRDSTASNKQQWHWMRIQHLSWHQEAAERLQQQDAAATGRREHRGAADEQQQLTKAMDGLGPVNVSMTMRRNNEVS